MESIGRQMRHTLKKTRPGTRIQFANSAYWPDRRGDLAGKLGRDPRSFRPRFRLRIGMTIAEAEQQLRAQLGSYRGPLQRSLVRAKEVRHAGIAAVATVWTGPSPT